MGLSELTFQSIAFRVGALLIIAGVHGGILAATAVYLGDKGPKYDGRLTILPFGHIDFFGAIGLIFYGLGWSKPVAIDAQQFRIGRGGIFVVILAGFTGLLVTAALLNALILPALTTIPLTAGLTTAAFLRAASSLSIWVALLSLIPIPPLTAGLLLNTLGVRVSRQAQWVLAAVLFGAVATGVVQQLLAPAYVAMASVILGQ